jgi:MerR family transcriptional regulator, heat shock protein HspR
MAEYQYTRITIHSDQSTTYYSEQEAAEYCQLEVRVIRRLQAAGLVEGIAISDEERRYRDEDIAQLRRIRRLHHDLGVNLAGIEVILRLTARLEALQRELER